MKKLGVAALVFMVMIFIVGCGHEGMTKADNSIDGTWYVYDDEKGTDMYGQIMLVMDISSNDDNVYYDVRLNDTVDGTINKTFVGGWFESKRELKMTDKINLQFSWFEYNIVGQWPINLLLDMDGTCTFSDIKTKAIRFGYPHRWWQTLTNQ